MSKIIGFTVAAVCLMNISTVRGIDFQPKKLRGYGVVSGTVEKVSGIKVLKIDCESPEKAALLQSKYLSDLKLGGPSRLRDHLNAYVKGKTVYILNGKNAKQIADYARANGLSAGKTVEVPMYLDAWDKYGFRFYYRPWAAPRGVRNYDPTGEFDFAEKLGSLGFVFWTKNEAMDFTYGLTNRRWWDWAERMASRRKLPIVLNTSNTGAPWLSNTFRDQTAMKAPQYCGSFHSVAKPDLGGTGFISWASTQAKGVEMSILQRLIKQYSKYPNVIEYLEPHGEPFHGKYTMFLEYGPVADKSYRKYLKEQFGSLDKVANRWGVKLNSWDDVKLPELASFLGWSKDALDLTGTWKLKYMKLKKKVNLRAYNRKIIPVDPAPEAWYGSKLDDSSWGSLTAPGNDEMMFLEQRPAVMRRYFNVDGNFLKRHKQLWLYIWDLNFGHRDEVKAVVNDKLAGIDKIPFFTPHWAAFNVTGLLKPGQNLLAVRLPKGYIGYRTYISPEAPKNYPYLGKHRNAQWVDFIDWRRWITYNAVERGMSMIRQVDKKRSIICMAPDSYAENIRKLCYKYGGHFRNTGYMGGVWAEFLPMLMRGANLPMSVEPGGPASNLPGFKKMLGLYFTSGVNALNYFIHVGSIMWNKPIREHFEKTLPMIKMFGKMHQEKSQIAVLFNSRAARINDYPWKSDYNTIMPQGYWNWRVNSVLYQYYKTDGLMPGDFFNGLADPYKVIIDSNNMILSRKQVAGIEDWVRKGGIFFTFVQTGRHTDVEPDSWPISKLTGYKVTGIHKYDGEKPEWGELELAKGQKVFDKQLFRRLRSAKATGLMMKAEAPECIDVLKWQDGSTALGLRKLGKGLVVHIGFKFMSGTCRWQDNRTMMLFLDLLKWCGMKQNTGYANNVKMSHYVTNNGLKDVWVMWNPNHNKDITTELKFRDGNKRLLTNILTGKPASQKFTLKPYETLMLTSDVADVASAGEKWFTLQRGWWNGTATPPAFEPGAQVPDLAVNLNADWKLKELASGQKADSLVGPSVDDASWRNINLGIWKYPIEVKSKDLVLRRHFTVPDWSAKDEIYFAITAWYTQMTLVDNGRMRVWLDGKPIGGNLRPNHGIPGLRIKLKPGSRHLLALEIIGTEKSGLPGVRGSCFLYRIKAPDQVIDLKGKWLTSGDVLTTGQAVSLPGNADTLIFKREVELPADLAGKQVYLVEEGSSNLIGSIINGSMIRRHHHCVGEMTYLNITPWIKPGQSNLIELVRWFGKGKTSVRRVQLYIYDK